MKIIVVSDSHGKNEALENVLLQHPDADIYVHCGDIEASEGTFPQFITVRGNNDMFCEYPDQQVLQAEGHGIYVCHSHQFMYSRRAAQMAEKAKSLACDIVFYGHTHVAAFEEIDGVRLVNPGSIWRSRDGRGPSYAVVTLTKDAMDVQFEFIPQPQKKSRWFF